MDGRTITRCGSRRRRLTWATRVAVVLLVAGSLVAGSLVAGTLGGSPAGAAVPNIRCGDTVTASLVANSDLTCTGTALTIGADDVVLDLGGHRVTGDGTGVGVRIPGRQRVTVTHGTITGFVPAVAVSFSQDIMISRLTISGVGIDATLGTPPSQRVTITRVALSGGLTGGLGLRSISLTRSTVTGGLISFSDSAGPYLIADNKLLDTSVHFSESNGGQIVDNVLTGSSVSYRAISFGAVVSGNRFRDGGVAFDASPRAVVEGNRFDNGGVVDFFSEDVSIRNNRITGDPAAGVRVEIGLIGGSPPTGIEILGNTLRRNGSRPPVAVDLAGRPVDDGIHVNAPAGSGITIADNHTAHNADFGIEAQPGTVIDGGGNTSSHDPQGCLGVVCTKA